MIVATKTAYIIPLIQSTMGITTNKSHQSLKPLNFRPALYTRMLMQTAVTLKMQHHPRVSAEQ
jgi:hypothetical protein